LMMIGQVSGKEIINFSELLCKLRINIF
jgi:hypothetical protein